MNLLLSKINPDKPGLWILAGPSGSGKTRLMKEICNEVGVARVNVSELLSELIITGQIDPGIGIMQKVLELAEQDNGKPVCLDNTEILFSPMSQVIPFDLLNFVSKTHSIIATVPCRITDNLLKYATPGHPEWTEISVSEIRGHIFNVKEGIWLS